MKKYVMGLVLYRGRCKQVLAVPGTCFCTAAVLIKKQDTVMQLSFTNLYQILVVYMKMSLFALSESMKLSFYGELISLDCNGISLLFILLYFSLKHSSLA